MPTQTEQIIQKAEKKIKNMKKLEKILIGGAALGIGAGFTGLYLDNKELVQILYFGGFGVGAASTIAGYNFTVGRKYLEKCLKDYKKNNPPLIKLELKAEEPYKIVYDDKGEK